MLSSCYSLFDFVLSIVLSIVCVCKILYFVTLPAIDVFFFSRKSVGVSHCMCVWTALFHTLFLS